MLSPLKGWGRPTPADCKAVHAALVRFHERVDKAEAANCGRDFPKTTVLDSLVRTILSQNTTDATSHRAFAELKQRLPTWEEVMRAPSETVEDAIRIGGLAAIKVQRIKAILEALHAERGACCLEHLRSCSEEEVKSQLGRYKGVGPKTIACVLLFALGRTDFPVDTHVWHICKRLGWLPQQASREAAYLHLNAVIPAHLKYDLHVLLVEHGKVCGACKKKPRSGGPPCPLSPLLVKQEPGTDVEVEEEGPAAGVLGNNVAGCSGAAAIKEESMGAGNVGGGVAASTAGHGVGPAGLHGVSTIIKEEEEVVKAEQGAFGKFRRKRVKVERVE